MSSLEIEKSSLNLFLNPASCLSTLNSINNLQKILKSFGILDPTNFFQEGKSDLSVLFNEHFLLTLGVLFLIVTNVLLADTINAKGISILILLVCASLLS